MSDNLESRINQEGIIDDPIYFENYPCYYPIDLSDIPEMQFCDFVDGKLTATKRGLHKFHYINEVYKRIYAANDMMAKADFARLVTSGAELHHIYGTTKVCIAPDHNRSNFSTFHPNGAGGYKTINQMCGNAECYDQTTGAQLIPVQQCLEVLERKTVRVSVPIPVPEQKTVPKYLGPIVFSGFIFSMIAVTALTTVRKLIYT